MREFRMVWMGLALLWALPACGGDDDPSGPATSFTATLSGDEEVPPVTTTAMGSAELTVSGNQRSYEL